MSLSKDRLSIKEVQYINSIVLSAVGDAMGWMTEAYSNPSEVNDVYGEFPITKFHCWKKFNGSRFNGFLENITAGSYSDDTQLMLAMARSIKSYDNCDSDYFSKIEMVGWLNYKRGAGKTITEAAHKIKRKSASWTNNFFTFKQKDMIVDYRDCGANGAAMRILPISLVYQNDLSKTLEEVFCNSIITHGHPRAIIGAMLYSFILNAIMNKQYTCSIDLIEYVGKNIKNYFYNTLSKMQNRSDLSDWFVKWNLDGRDFVQVYNTTIEECLDILRKGYVVLKRNNDFDDFISDSGALDKISKGSGTISVLCAFFCFCKFKIFKTGLEYTVNLLGADTDSVAAFYAAMFGLSTVEPLYEKYYDVQDFNYLKLVAQYLFQVANKQSEVIDIRPNSRIILNDSKIFNHQALGYGDVLANHEFETLTKGMVISCREVQFHIGQSAVIIERLKRL